MNIEIICIGKLKEKYWTDAIAEYSKRLSRFCKFTVTELPETKLIDNASPAQELAVVVSESNAVLKRLEKKPGAYVIALAVKGQRLTSEAFAKKLSDVALAGKSDVVFLIGGSLGMSDELLNAADYKLSFSDMTFPHQLMRVILTEQIYRCFKINNNETYHK